MVSDVHSVPNWQSTRLCEAQHPSRSTKCVIYLFICIYRSNWHCPLTQSEAIRQHISNAEACSCLWCMMVFGPLGHRAPLPSSAGDDTGRQNRLTSDAVTANTALPKFRSIVAAHRPSQTIITVRILLFILPTDAHVQC